jgi:threonine dehydratase
MPVTTPLVKVENVRSYGAQVELFGTVYDDAYARARDLQKEKGFTFIHPFDDYDVMAGQGTVGLEIMEQLRDVECIVVPIGGGGLIAGIAIAAKAINPDVHLIGVQAKTAAPMVASFAKGEVVRLSSAATIADGIQVKQSGVLTFEVCRKLVDTVVTVEEDQIHSAIVFLMEKHHAISEGAGAVPVAAYLAGLVPPTFKKVCLLVSGGNIDVNLVSRLVQRCLLAQRRRLHFETKVSDKPGEMAKLLQLIASLHANLYSVQQTRHVHNLGLTFMVADIMIETNGADHTQRILDTLHEQGYEVTEQ